MPPYRASIAQKATGDMTTTLMTAAPDTTALARRALDIVNCPHPDVPSDVRVALLLDTIRQTYGDAVWGDVCRRMATLAAEGAGAEESELARGYREYCSRFTLYRQGTPMTFAEYCTAHERWQREYEAAWDAWDAGNIGNPPVVDELEYLLVV